MAGELDQVAWTATSVLQGRLAAREAVTILATLTREALPTARELRTSDPTRADTYHELVLALGRELRRSEATSSEARHVRALTDDLARLLRALE